MKLSRIQAPIQVVCGFLIQENKLLLGLRPPGKHLSGHWEIPGGKLEKGETYQQALQRELLEELDIQVLVSSYLTSVTHDYGEKCIELHGLLVKSFRGEPKALEHSSLQFFSFEKLLDQKLGKADQLLLGCEKISQIFQ